MREVIVVQIGQCGNRIGTKFWETIAKEHGVNTTTGAFQGDSQLREENIGAYFHQTPDNHFRPRAVMVDLDPRTIDTVQAGPLGKLFNTDNFVCGFGSAQKNNYASAYYDSESRRLAEYYEDVLQNQVEKCDRYQGVTFVHSVSGGAGSGLASRIFDKTQACYCGTAQSISVLPSPTASNSVVQPYNSVLILQKLRELISVCVVIDNDALSSICTRSLKKQRPSFDDMNQLIANAMSGISSSYRFRGRPTMGILKQSINLHYRTSNPFCMVSLSPLSSGVEQHRHLTTLEVTKKMFDQKNFLCSANLNSGKFITGLAQYKGFTTELEINSLLSKYKADHPDKFSPYFDNIVTSYVESPSKQALVSATLLCQNSAMKEVLGRQISSAKTLSDKEIYGPQTYDKDTPYKRGAFFYKLQAYGVDHSQLSQAIEHVRQSSQEGKNFEEVREEYNQNDDDNEGNDDS